jgi:hypothetical protein|tara:strand:+ start:43 stop:312 length:270 start_codon:yes stop_codon:yes gene_type:complete
MKTYIIQSQDMATLDKHLQWTHNVDSSSLFYTPHRDIALNQLIELNAKNISLRASIVECAADPKGRPVVVLDALNTEQTATDEHQFSAA